jgi:hypothetical protein
MNFGRGGGYFSAVKSANFLVNPLLPKMGIRPGDGRQACGAGYAGAAFGAALWSSA